MYFRQNDGLSYSKQTQRTHFNFYQQHSNIILDLFMLTIRSNILHALPQFRERCKHEFLFWMSFNLLRRQPFYESQTMSSARRLVCIFFKSLSRWRLPCALLQDDDGLAADEELPEIKTLPQSASDTTSDFLPRPFGVLFMTPFLKSCNAW